jgi:hypothetical protein
VISLNGKLDLVSCLILVHAAGFVLYLRSGGLRQALIESLAGAMGMVPQRWFVRKNIGITIVQLGLRFTRFAFPRCGYIINMPAEVERRSTLV